MKTCSVCQIPKPEDLFQKRTASKDGLTAACRDCLHRRDKARYEKERDHRLERHKAYSKTPEGNAAAVKAKAAWIARNSDRRAAHVILGNAIKYGRLVPWPVCAIHDCEGKPEAHHPDYGHPLDVVWLCDKHHKEAHVLGRELNRKRI